MPRLVYLRRERSCRPPPVERGPGARELLAQRAGLILDLCTAYKDVLLVELHNVDEDGAACGPQ